MRVADGKTQVLDGPYADSKEQFGGFHIIDVPDLDAAIGWAARSPTALHGVVEVRPLFDIAAHQREFGGKGLKAYEATEHA